MADFPVTPDYPVEETPKFKTLVSTFDNGSEQRRGKWASVLREFSLSFTNRDEVEFVLFRDFFLSKKGPLLPFTFVNPNDDETYTVRFKEDQVTYSQKSRKIFDFQCVLVEVKS